MYISGNRQKPTKHYLIAPYPILLLFDGIFLPSLLTFMESFSFLSLVF